MRVVPFLLLSAASCCTTTLHVGDARPRVLRDVEGYAIASCLAHQSDPVLKDQGDGWASAIIQRGEGDIDKLAAVGEKVKTELSKGDMAVIRVESPSGASDKPMPVLYCSEIIDKPAIRAEIRRAVAELAPGYAD